MTSKGFIGAVMAATLLAASGAATAQAGAVCGTFQVVAAPDISAPSVVVKAIAAADASNAWAVGEAGKGDPAAPGTAVAFHWDGSTWAVEPLPDLSYLGSGLTLDAVAIVTSAAVKGPVSVPVTVGHYTSAGSGLVTPIALRFQGGFWEVMELNFGSGSTIRPSAFLRDVVAFAADASLSGTKGWAVGETNTDGVRGPFVARFDGNSWTEYPADLRGQVTTLSAVSAASPSDVWAVGSFDVPTLVAPSATAARIIHFNGRGWSVIDQPAAGRAGTVLNHVAVISAQDVWAAGQNGTNALLLHFDGTSWSEVAPPVTGAVLTIEGTKSDDVWAVSSNAYLHFDGKGWTAIAAANMLGTSERRAVAVVGPCDVWSVGSLTENGSTVALFERLTPDTTTEPPAAPKIVSAIGEGEQVTLDIMLAAPDVTGYDVERCSGDSATCVKATYSLLATMAAKFTQYQDLAVDSETYYTYRIRAFNGGGYSEYSMTATVWVLDNQPPTDPVPAPPTTKPATPTATDPVEVLPTADIPVFPSTSVIGLPSGSTSVQGKGEPTPPIWVPTPVPPSEPTTGPSLVCNAVTADMVIAGNSTRPNVIEALLRDDEGTILEGRCLPMTWEVIDGTSVKLLTDASTRFATVIASAGTYTIRATASNGVHGEVTLTLN